jgi:predicted MPP superfamily phosphohydrolase
MRQKMLIYFLVFLAILIGANFYLAYRFAFFFESVSTWPFLLLFGFITIYMIMGVMGLVNATGTLANIGFGIAAILMGFMLYLLISTIAVDLTRIFIKIPPKTSALIAISLAVLVSGYGLWNAAAIRLKSVDIKMEGISQPFKAAHLTDTHLGHFRGSNNLQNIVNMINAQNVDVVFFTGDLFDGLIQLKPGTIDPLKNLDAPVYFVEGNHDVYTGTQTIKQQLRNIGVHVLENEVVNWKDLQIVGLDHMLADENAVSPHADPNGPTIQKTLASMNINENQPTVLLHHGPDGIKYANEAGVDLYLAGHTHAGQLWPATHVAKMIFEYNKGLHAFEGTQVYVSQGTGTFGPPMRVGTQSELTILNINPEQ